MKIKSGNKVQLKSFNGASSAPDGCDPEENYWLLVSTFGTVIKPENKQSRVLVQFDTNISSLGLHCHNEPPNSLLISVNDLKVI